MSKRTSFQLALLSLSLAFVNVGCGNAETVVAQQEPAQKREPSQSAATGDVRGDSGDSEKAEDKPASAEDEASIRESLAKLSKLLEDKDFKSAARLMTPEALTLHLADSLWNALALAADVESPELMLPILKEHRFDQFADDAFDYDNQELMEKRFTAPFKTTEEMVAALERLAKEEEAAFKATQETTMSVSPFAGKVKRTIVGDEDITVEVMPIKPEMLGGNGKPDETFSFFLKFRKAGDVWKFSGWDDERMDAAMGDMDMEGYVEQLDTEVLESAEFGGSTLDGEKVILQDYRGKVVLLDFWGTWCGPCVDSLPEMQELHGLLNSKGFEVVGIAVDEKGALERFFKKQPLPWKNIVDDKEQGGIADQVGVMGFPTTVLLDKSGKVISANLHGRDLASELVKRLELDEATAKKLSEIVGKSGDGHGGGSGTGASRLNTNLLESEDFGGTTLSGEKVTLKDYRGKLLLVDFWGTWCGPCVAGLPELKEIQETLKGREFDILGIALDDKAAVKRFFKKTPLPWQNIIDTSDKGGIVDQVGIRSFPTAVLLDRDGKVLSTDAHGRVLFKLLAEKLHLDEATSAKLSDVVGADDGTDAGHAGMSGEPDPNLAIGYGAADANDDGKVSAKEMETYLEERLAGLNVPHARVFKDLDTDKNSFLSRGEFAKRHPVIESYVGVPVGPGPMPEDPGKDYRLFRGADQPINDREIMGALYHRADDSASPLQIKLSDIPKSLSSPAPTAKSGNRDVDDLVKATVVLAAKSGEGFFTGGAVLVSSDGLALTNYHIAMELESAKMVALTSDGKTHRVAEFLAGNPDRDVALIRLKGAGFPHVAIAKTVPKMGDGLVMIHHTENRFYTYDRGYVMRHPMVGKHEWMEISADYAPGGSGCGIFNKQNELIGLVSIIQFGDGPSLADPLTKDDLSQNGNVADRPEDEGLMVGMIMVKHAASLSAIRSLWKSE